MDPIELDGVELPTARLEVQDEPLGPFGRSQSGRGMSQAFEGRPFAAQASLTLPLVPAEDVGPLLAILATPSKRTISGGPLPQPLNCFVTDIATDAVPGSKGSEEITIGLVMVDPSDFVRDDRIMLTSVDRTPEFAEYLPNIIFGDEKDLILFEAETQEWMDVLPGANVKISEDAESLTVSWPT